MLNQLFEVFRLPLGKRSLLPLSSVLLGGILMGLTPVYAWPLAWVALAPLWWIAQDSEQSVQSVQSVRRALLYAAIWGVVYHAIALSWVTGLHPLTWMGVPWLASIAIALS
ncbi:MAG: apolipoprotein N-acyltransferase, partial [Phormidesmis priestleyi]